MKGRVIGAVVAAPVLLVAACGSLGADSDKPTVDDAGPTTQADASSTADGDASLGPDSAVDPSLTFEQLVLGMPGLVGYWHLDRGGDPIAKDVSGKGHDGEYVGEVVTASSLLKNGDNGAAEFATATLPVAAMHVAPDGLPTFANTLTVGALFRLTKLADNQWILSKGNAFGFAINAQSLSFTTARGTILAPTVLATATTPIEVGQTYFVVGVVDAMNLKQRLFMNGTALDAQPDPRAVISDDNPFCVASAASGPACTVLPMRGVVDEVFLSDQALDDDYIRALTKLAL